MTPTRLIRQLRELGPLPALRPSEARFLIDDGLVFGWNLFARAKALTLPPDVRRTLRRNAAFRGLHTGKRCWIIGNGPSLNDQDLTLLRDEHTFVVNRFIHHAAAEKVDPKYYVIVDPKFGAGTWGSDFVGELERRLPNVWMFTTPEGQRFLDDNALLARHRRSVVLPNQLFTFGYPWDIDLTQGIPGMDNVTKVAVCIAVWLGFKRINLLGIDGNGLLLRENSHFYGHVPPPSDQAELEKSLVSSALGMRGWRSLVHYLADRGIELVSMNPASVLTALPYQPFAV